MEQENGILHYFLDIAAMPKRKLLSEMSKHYRRLKCSTRNITLAENINSKLSTDFANIP